MKRKTRMIFIGFFLYQASIIYYAWKDVYSPVRPNYAIELITGSFFAIFTIIHLFLLIRDIFEDAKLESSIQMIKQQQRMKNVHTQSIYKRQKETQAIQQSTKEQLEALYMDLKSKNHSHAISYFEQISQTLQKNRFNPCCSDSLLNAILDSKRHDAEEHGILINYQIILPPNYKLISSSISCIFFNLLDNGIESCICSDCARPFLKLNTAFQDDCFIIHMQNSKDPSVPFSHQTSKQESMEHGFGLAIIEEKVNSYDGSYEWLDHGDIFESIILLPYKNIIT